MTDKAQHSVGKSKAEQRGFCTQRGKHSSVSATYILYACMTETDKANALSGKTGKQRLEAAPSIHTYIHTLYLPERGVFFMLTRRIGNATYVIERKNSSGKLAYTYGIVQILKKYVQNNHI